MKISVVLATFNGEKFLAQQLESIVAQSRPPDEILIKDDGSCDKTLAICSTYAARHPSIQITRNEANRGINATFYALLKESTGDLVFISDQDDLWSPNKIQEMAQRWSNESAIYSDAQVIDEQGKLLYESELDFHNKRPVIDGRADRLLFQNCVSGHNLAVSKDFIDRIPEFPNKSPVMYDHCLAYLACTHRGLKYVDKKLCRHRIHAANANNNKKLNRKTDTRTFRKKERALQNYQYAVDFAKWLSSLNSDDFEQSEAATALIKHLSSNAKPKIGLRAAMRILQIWEAFFPEKPQNKRIRRMLLISTSEKAPTWLRGIK